MGLVSWNDFGGAPQVGQRREDRGADSPHCPQSQWLDPEFVFMGTRCSEKRWLTSGRGHGRPGVEVPTPRESTSQPPYWI